MNGATQRDDEALHTWLTGVIARRRAGRDTGAGPGRLVVVVDRPLEGRLAAVLREARDAGVVLLTAAASVEDLPVAVDAVLRLTGETGALGTLSRPAAPDLGSVLVDRLPEVRRRAVRPRSRSAGAGDRRPRRGRPAVTSEQFERRPDLLGRVPGQLVALRLVDDELRVVAAEVRLQDDGDRGLDVVLGVRAVEVGAGHVAELDIPLDPHRAALGVGVVDGVDRAVGHVGGQHDPTAGGERVDVQQPQAGPRGGQQGRVLELFGVGLGLAERVELPQAQA